MAEFDALMRNAIRGQGARSAVALPWEQGWLRLVLGGGSIFPMDYLDPPTWSGPIPAAPWERFREVEDVSEIEEDKECVSECAVSMKRIDFAKVGRRRRCIRTEAQHRDDRRARALAKWLTIIEEAGEASKLFRQLTNAEGDAGDAILSDTFEEKSTATLEKRACAILLFMRWARPMAAGQCIPFKEDAVYAYIAFMRSEGAPPTRGQSFVEAVAFAESLLGLNQKEEVLSHRVRGATMQLWSQKRVLKPRDPFTKEMVAILEETTEKHPDIRVRVFAGFCCALTHMRCRVSDAQRALKGPTLDYCTSARPAVFHVALESASDRIKTGQERKKARRQYHLVGHAVGIRGNRWAEHWISAREACGLDLEIDGVLMPAPQRGGFGMKAMANEEMTLWLREILVQGGLTAGAVWNTGMHSPKATLLSWAAKFGIDKETRKDLGGHVQASDASVAAYSRDLLAAPLRKLAEVLVAVKNGIFDPDATRAGAWRDIKIEIGDDEEEEAVVAVPGSASPVPTSPAARSEEGGREYEHEKVWGAFERVVDKSPSGEGESNHESDGFGEQEGPPDENYVPPSTPRGSWLQDESDGEENAELTEDEESPVRLDLEDEALAEECHDVVEKEIIVKEVQCEKGNIPKGGLWRHTSRGTLHLHGSLMGRTGDYLVCCRVITKTYEELENWPTDANGRCKSCFGATKNILKELLDKQ
jgi:hypothetical protein